MGSKRQNFDSLEKYVSLRREPCKGGEVGWGRNPKKQQARLFPDGQDLIKQLVSNVFIPCGMWKSSSRFSIKGAAFLFILLTFVLNVNNLMLSIMVPLSENVD